MFWTTHLQIRGLIIPAELMSGIKSRRFLLKLADRREVPIISLRLPQGQHKISVLVQLLKTLSNGTLIKRKNKI